ncbi:MAG: valine--tRNA ligase [Planctomycetes bacterium]|nr:valine--tRNA ligase [Planctomycetota bacterium]
MKLDSRYDAHAHEAKVYQAWMDQGAFTPSADAEGREPYVIMIPPPNVTGVLHVGHALNGALQDIVIRFQRMRGRDALWLPGTDHAGIATQAVVEKQLYLDEGKTRQDIGREAFVEKIWEWKEVHGNKILEQYRRLGASCDWTRTRFTFEPHMSRAVREAFVRLWEKGLIYRGARLVNWDCTLQTAVSDDEVEMTALKGKLYFLRYPVKEVDGAHLTVATTRPETMLGDTGVAVHPEDERYKDLVGKHVLLPFVGREIPIVADVTVEREFGTGAVKVTPGHDPADYERGQRAGLPTINILEKDGKLNDNAGPFAGFSREEARKRVVAEMDGLGLLEKTETYQHNVPISDRSKSVIEPLLSEQWFVKMEPLAKPAIEAVKNGSLEFRPGRWTKVYLDWLENVQDWCISRQLWWGHRIPVWYDEDGTPVASRDDLEIGSLHPETKKPIVRQDEDVLDTWASSWLWPFATLGWPDRTPDLSRFYPTHFLSTAREIIYLWVARMVMAGYELLDHLPVEERCPFSTCYVHATVLDGKGKRMSKSAGNGIDPIDMIERYGADAVRLSLVLLTREGQDVKLSEDRFEMGRRFTNKVWNAVRFALGHLENFDPDAPLTPDASWALEDRWILSRLARATQEVTQAYEEYRFNDAATTLYRFVWNDFCDWYLELVKSRLEGDEASAEAARHTLAQAMNGWLALLHPITPFQTEVLWKACAATRPKPIGGGGMLITSAWPDKAGRVDEAAEAEIELLQGLVHAVRSVRALTTIGDRRPLPAIVAVPRAEDRAVLQACAKRARALAHLETLEIHEAAERPPSSAVAVAPAFEVFIPLGADVDLGELAATLKRRVEKLEKGLRGIEGKLKNQGFLKGADPDVVEAEKSRCEEMKRELDLLSRNLAGLT